MFPMIVKMKAMAAKEASIFGTGVMGITLPAWLPFVDNLGTMAVQWTPICAFALVVSQLGYFWWKRFFGKDEE